jgi:major membrane immunogen (membrane-anchored lipoprotein)
MKKFSIAAAIVALVLVLAACGNSVSYKDGFYRATADEFGNGWRYFVEATVADGKIVSVTFDADPEEGTRTKYEVSKAGEYGMVENGGAQWPWWEQADALTKHLVDSQSLEMPDAVSGATIGIDGFFDLAKKAIPVAAE